MKFLLIVALVVAGVLLYLNTGAKKADTNVYAKFYSNSSVEIAGQILTVDEAINYVNSIVTEGKVVDISISGNKGDQEQLEAIAKKFKLSHSFKGRNVLVIVAS